MPADSPSDGVALDFGAGVSGSENACNQNISTICEPESGKPLLFPLPWLTLTTCSSFMYSSEFVYELLFDFVKKWLSPFKIHQPSTC